MRVHHFLLSACFWGVAISASTAADKLPPLTDTVLYTQTASSCWSIDLKTWKHPIKAILAKYRIGVSDIELCNEGKYPILHADLKYDPEENNKYDYADFFKDLLRENHYQPLAVVDETRGKILTLSWTDTHDVHVAVERFDAQ